MRPVIGIETDVELSASNGRPYSKCYLAYAERVWRAGGEPRLLAPIDDPDWIAHLSSSLDGLVIPGGDDIEPRFFGEDELPTEHTAYVAEARYHFGRKLVEAMLATDRPILGICYGAQLVNLALGGTIWQDLERQCPETGRHRAFGRVDHRHEVTLEAGSRLAAVLGEETSINSVHHQAIREPGEGLSVVARAPDGVIEGVESMGSERLLWLLQWHPERDPGQAAGAGVFEAFVAAAHR